MKCPVCGSKMKMDGMSVCTSIPPKYIYRCKNCGKVEYSIERESLSETKENNSGLVFDGKYVSTTTLNGHDLKHILIKQYTTLKELYDCLCNKYRNEFMEMYFTDEKGTQPGNFWIGDNIGEMLDVAGEYTFDFATIRYAVDNKINPDRLFEWLDYCRKVSDFGIKTPTLKDFYHGAPLVSDEQLEKLAKLKQDYENEVERYNDSWEKGGF